MYKLYEKENLKVYAGVVVSSACANKNGKKIAQIMLKDFSGNEMAFYFVDGESSSDFKAKRAEIVEKMNLKQNDFIAIIAMCSDESKGTATGVRVIRNGKTSIGDYNIFVGNATVNERNQRTDVFNISVPVVDYSGEEKIVKWHQINFWNNDKKNRADISRRIIGSHKTCRVAVLTGKIDEKETNSKVYYNTVGFTLVRCPDIE